MKIKLSQIRFICLLYLVVGLLSFSGCIRVTGNAGYSKIQDDEIVTKSTGFDLDSSRLVDNRGIS
ncbi:MAG TPA: hypothetical protein PLY88_04285 [Candidatus Omnitrophota bacterium]|nr:hypothetical protein [Candidatus Omnitrophota bacterium]